MKPIVLLPLIFLSHTCQEKSPQEMAQEKLQEKAGEAKMAPRLRLRISGNLLGRLEPCGCASGQLGGLSRRVRRLLLDKLDFELLIEGGNLVDGSTELDESKLFASLTILKEAGYHALGLGSQDLELDYDFLSNYLSGVGIPVIASDLQKKSGGDWITLPHLELEVQGTKLRIASLTCKLPKKGAGKSLSLLPSDLAWLRAMQGVAPATYRILLVHDEAEKVLAVAKFEPKPDLIIAVNNDHVEPPASASRANGVPILHPGIRGRLLVDATLVRDSQGPRLVRYRAIKLEGSKTAPGAMRNKVADQIILSHRQEVMDSNLREKLAGQHVIPDGKTYVGTQVCADCHDAAYETWNKMKHSQAWEVLEKEEKAGKRFNWPITHYPDCVKCHTVGYTQKSGFISPEKTPDLKAVGCEACHGPGSKHANADLPEEIKMGEVGAKRCMDCHDFEQTPDFDFTRLWKKIEHGL